MADNAGGYPALTLAPPGHEVLTVEYKINFLAPALGEKLGARGEVLITGRRLFVCRAEVVAVSNGEEVSCAALQQTISLAPSQTEQKGS
ncbi:MAG: PaaI family thioesterase [Rubrobacter sp.]|nr:PaaI family thioesterase [Rubrobacter sp.]